MIIYKKFGFLGKIKFFVCKKEIVMFEWCIFKWKWNEINNNMIFVEYVFDLSLFDVLIKLKVVCMIGELDILMDYCNIIEVLFKRSENLLLVFFIFIYNRYKDNIIIYRYIVFIYYRNCLCIYKKI